MTIAPRIAREVELEARNTLRIPGRAEYFLEAKSVAELIEAVRWAEAKGLAVTVLGGGSNVVVPHDGVRGLVIAPKERGIHFVEGSGREVFLDARAGEPWEALVEAAVSRGLAGIECLTGIPGLAGRRRSRILGRTGRSSTSSSFTSRRSRGRPVRWCALSGRRASSAIARAGLSGGRVSSLSWGCG